MAVSSADALGDKRKLYSVKSLSEMYLADQQTLQMFVVNKNYQVEENEMGGSCSMKGGEDERV
jgi:hypothetical protein